VSNGVHQFKSLVLTCLLLGLVLLRPVPVAAEELMVFAAASLGEVFSELRLEFEALNPGLKVICNFAGSQMLAAQIQRGAQADLFAAANEEVMRPLQKRQEILPPVFFAGNELIMIVAPAAVDIIPEFSAAAEPGRLLAIGTPQVPIGAYTRQFLGSLEQDPAFDSSFVSRFRRNVVSEETNVKAIVAKVALGEVDAGIVYRTDLTPRLARQVLPLPLPASHLPAVRYPLAALRQSAHPEAGARFIDFLFSPAGREVLLRHGFTPGEAP